MSRNSDNNLRVVVCVLLAAGLLPSAAASGVVLDGPGAMLAWADLAVGDVVARGVRAGVGCTFETPVHVRVSGTFADAAGSLVTDLRLMSGCVLVVVEKARLAVPSLVVPGGYHSAPDVAGDSDDAPLQVTAQTKHVNNRVIHYATGGRDDIATEKQEAITFTWDGSTATLTDDSGNCYWAQSWVNDACVRDGRITSGDYVSRASHGDFHWDPWFAQPGYYHTLTARTFGFDDGTHECDFHVSGEIVSGVYNECTVS